MSKDKEKTVEQKKSSFSIEDGYFVFTLDDFHEVSDSFVFTGVLSEDHKSCLYEPNYGELKGEGGFLDLSKDGVGMDPRTYSTDSFMVGDDSVFDKKAEGIRKSTEMYYGKLLGLFEASIANFIFCAIRQNSPVALKGGGEEGGLGLEFSGYNPVAGCLIDGNIGVSFSPNGLPRETTISIVKSDGDASVTISDKFFGVGTSDGCASSKQRSPVFTDKVSFNVSSAGDGEKVRISSPRYGYSIQMAPVDVANEEKHGTLSLIRAFSKVPAFNPFGMCGEDGDVTIGEQDGAPMVTGISDYRKDVFNALGGSIKSAVAVVKNERFEKLTSEQRTRFLTTIFINVLKENKRAEFVAAVFSQLQDGPQRAEFVAAVFGKLQTDRDRSRFVKEVLRNTPSDERAGLVRDVLDGASVSEEGRKLFVIAAVKSNMSLRHALYNLYLPRKGNAEWVAAVTGNHAELLRLERTGSYKRSLDSMIGKPVDLGEGVGAFVETIVFENRHGKKHTPLNGATTGGKLKPASVIVHVLKSPEMALVATIYALEKLCAVGSGGVKKNYSPVRSAIRFALLFPVVAALRLTQIFTSPVKSYKRFFGLDVLAAKGSAPEEYVVPGGDNAPSSTYVDLSCKVIVVRRDSAGSQESETSTKSSVGEPATVVEGGRVDLAEAAEAGKGKKSDDDSGFDKITPQ